MNSKLTKPLRKMDTLVPLVAPALTVFVCHRKLED